MPLFGRAVRSLDRYLRHRMGIYEFTNDGECLLRIELGVSPASFTLSDGTRISAGDAVIEIHLWNEHVPTVPPDGPNLAWAKHLRRSFGHSLTALATHVAHDPELEQSRAIRGRTLFWSARCPSQVQRVVRDYGFDLITLKRPVSITDRLYDVGENLLVCGLVQSYNPGARRPELLTSDRQEIWMSRRNLLALHGQSSRPAWTS